MKPTATQAAIECGLLVVENPGRQATSGDAEIDYWARRRARDAILEIAREMTAPGDYLLREWIYRWMWHEAYVAQNAENVEAAKQAAEIVKPIYAAALEAATSDVRRAR